MAGWIPMPANGWAETAAILTASGKPWPRSAVIFDLRWHADQKVGVPGRGGLMDRWGWSDREVRKLLATPEVWWDSAKGPAPTDRAQLDGYIGTSVPGVRRSAVLPRTQLGPTSVLPASKPVPSSGREDANNPDDITQPVPSLYPACTQLGPTSVHRATDGGSQPQPPTQPPAHEQGASPLDPVHLGADPALSVTDGLLFHQRPSEAVQTPQATTDLALTPPKASRAKPAPAKGMDPEVARVWEAYRVHHPATKSPGKRDIAGAIADHGVDAVLLMVEWVHLDPSEDADYLRRKGYHVNETLWREKTRGRYVYLAEQWQKRGRAAPATTRALPAREQIADDKIAQWAASMSRDVIDVEPLNVITYKEPSC